MRNILVEILCRHCYYHTHIKSDTLVQPSMEPELRKRILNHTMFTYACPKCHEKITFIHNFLYHDPEHKFLIYMSLDQQLPMQLQEQFPNAILRHVSNPEDLAEMVRILEDGLDDTILSSITKRLCEKEETLIKVRYHDLDRSSNTIWLEFHYPQAMEYKAIQKDSYDRIAMGNRSGKGKHDE